MTIQKNSSIYGTANLLPASKSISNRVLIINALAGNASQLHNLSDANDTQLMLRLVNSKDRIIDVEDAGTTMRFLTAYFSITNQRKVLTGTQRMKERPIGILVDALRTLGADIDYQEKEGYPPLTINGFNGQKTTSLKIRGDISSQFISAIMMVAPVLPQGIKLELEGKIGSRPYIEMTASLMAQFGVKTKFVGNLITVTPQTYTPTEFTVESDWSAASYWFAITALAEKAEVLLPRISLHSLQGDRAIVDIMKTLGVEAEIEGSQLKLSKGSITKELRWDFTHCPDLAQTVAVVCAAKGVKGSFTGLESLRIKETDRITALQNELKKIGADLIEESSQWTLVPTDKLPTRVTFATYKDHRMAMAFAPLATLMDVDIENPGVVKKSYPNYWNDLKAVGFHLTE
ncbi:3-phosphoshikimate 1-carboxyvinyltransferase [Fulvivirgaceae bacterium PWU20]|uniref:3-phosphoshikimate 1-carboxyvinyltransferase n=1 Tax=Chryseosolibacter indicus TaxID=2782351 RepID=A0ABS5VL72_9BACT|nr:3-phosphoshikimate 1-carboxyvinyltransferase [Chryseosolibacter indicus]